MYKQPLKQRIPLLVIFLFISLQIIACSSQHKESIKENVKFVSDEEITLFFSFGQKKGLYTGDLVNGLPHGTGVFSSDKNAVDSWLYSGDWDNGHMQGYGKRIWSNGYHYEGEYYADYEHGEGKYYKNDELIYEGKMLNGRFTKKRLDFEAMSDEVLFLARERDGYAWIDMEYGDDSIYQCISTSGDITTTLSEDMVPVTYIYNGVSFVKDENGVYSLVDTKGNIIFSNESLGVTGFILHEEHKYTWSSTITTKLDNPFLQQGYIIAYKVVESYDTVSYEIGILNTKGEWVSPLSKENPLLKTGFRFMNSSKEFLTEELWKKFFYIGENKMLFSLEEKDSYGMFDFATNTAIKLEDKIYDTSIDYIYLYDGISYYTANGMINTLDRNGKQSRSELEGEAVKDKINIGIDGVIFSDNSYHLFDKNGKLIADLSNLGLQETTLFVDGHSAAVIKNDIGSSFFTLINTKGEFKFEPIKIVEYMYIEYFDGTHTLIVTDSIYDKATLILLNSDGKELTTIVVPDYGGVEANNGVLQIKKDDGKPSYMNLNEYKKVY